MKDVIDVMSERLKAPYFGYIFLAFLALNWRGIFLLMASDASPAERLALFDSVTSKGTLFWFPIIAGLILAGLSYWLKYAFLWIASKPNRRIERLNQEAENHNLLHRNQLERQRARLIKKEEEQEAYDQANMDAQVEQLPDEKVRYKLKQTLSNIRKDIDTDISTAAKQIVLMASSNEQGRVKFSRTTDGLVMAGGDEVVEGKRGRIAKEMEFALHELSTKGYIQKTDDGFSIFTHELTLKGWKLADALKEDDSKAS